MGKDYYDILGIEKGASQDEIKKAFRKKAHTYHPDKKTGDEAKFKEVNEAYQVLGDEEKRKQYDQFGSTFDQQGGFGGNATWEDFMRQARGGNGGAHFDFGGMDFGDIFGDMFGFGGQRGRRQKRGNDIQIDVEITFDEMIKGTEKKVELTKNNACDTCKGNGAKPGSSLKSCGTCHGQGQVQQVQRTILGAMQTVVPCPECGGQGQIPDEKCPSCDGIGVKHSHSSYVVQIPAGIDSGQSIRLTGKGESIGSLGSPGDLYVRVHVKADNRFVRDGYDLMTEATISYPQAVLGDTIAIETPYGEKKLVIPAGTASGQKIRVKAHGIPHLRGSSKGDQYVTVTVDIPKKIGRKAKKLLQELQEEL